MSRGLLEAQRLQAANAIDRRAFLKIGLSIGAAVGGGLILGFSLPAAAQGRQGKVTPAIAGDGDLTPRDGVFEPNAFIQIDETGAIRLIVPKVEMGQGIYTSIPMLIAEELETPIDSVTIVHAPPNEKLYADPLLGAQMTGGSTSIRYAWEPMRRAGAAARTLLVAAAAQLWRVDPISCHAERGYVIHASTGKRIAYGELAASAARLPVPETVILKDPKDFRLIGTTAKRLDSPQKIDGSAKFGIDIRLPDMLYAIVVSCPVFGGKLISVDDSNARKIPGFRHIVKLDSSVAAIGDHTWAAKRGAAALLITWDEGPGANYSTETVVAELAAASQRPGAVARKTGDVSKAFANTKTQVSAVYQQPFLAHATMEPVNCTVSVRDDGCDIWVGTQVPTRAVDTAAAVTGLSPAKIKIHNHLLGGGFGRRLETDFIEHAVKIGKHVAAPVKVTWTREEDVQHDMYRPYYYDTLSAALDPQGKPVGWKHRIVGSSIIARFAPPIFKNGLDPDAIEVAAELLYTLPNQFVDYVRQEPQYVPTAFWRGVGPLRSTFVVESFIDELAALAKCDPVQYRRDLLLDSPRALNVIGVAAHLSGWGNSLPKNSGRGISFMHAFGSFLSMAVEVTVDSDGAVNVKRIVCAVDCGWAVNPNTIEAQIQGGVIFGLSAALHGEITIKNGRVVEKNFNDYRVLRINEIPAIEVHIVKSTEAPGGIGEPGTAALPPALTNAIFAATGKRIRRLPVGAQLREA